MVSVQKLNDQKFLVSLKPKHEEIMQVTAPSVQQAPGAEQIELKNLNEEEEENQEQESDIRHRTSIYFRNFAFCHVLIIFQDGKGKA